MQRRRPAPGATRRKTADDHDFLPTGNVFGSPRQLRHAASFCPRCPCSQSSPSISFSFFSLFFIGFPTAIAKEANVRNSHFLGDPGAKTVVRRDHRMTNACVSAGWVARRRKVQNEKRKEFVRWTIFLIFSSIAPKVAQGVACNAISLPAGTSEWLANDFPVSYLIKSSAVYKMPCENMCILHMYASYVWTCT